MYCTRPMSFLKKSCSYRWARLYSKSTGHVLNVSDEISSALHENKPVVALESTIITHGMPHPQNIRTAQEVESIVRNCGAIPATIAVLNKQLCVGLTSAQLDHLGHEPEKCVKVSRRDLPFAIAKGLTGGTTVSGTLIAAHMAGIRVFVTGGIGGVHRGAAHSFDVSADLRELGHTPVAVVCAGAKSILDIPATLEYLETEGVSVMTYGETTNFPAFFSSKSGLHAPYNVTSTYEAAEIIASNLKLQLGSGLLIGVPIPEEHSIPNELIDDIIEKALQEASANNIHGKAVTPFLLQRVNQITQGKSLEANIALIKNNAAVGSAIACALADIQNDGSKKMKSKNFTSTLSNSFKESKSSAPKRNVVVVGGVNVDFTSSFAQENVQANGGTYPGSVRQSFGGVGRNTADALTRLGQKDTLLVSAVGCDLHADSFFHHCRHMNLSGVKKCPGETTATYCAILQHSGDLIYGIGDFQVHNTITPQYVEHHANALQEASLVVMDGNISSNTMRYICGICSEHNVPVWFEPTDIRFVRKVFEEDIWKQLTYVSPNLNELRAFYSLISGKDDVVLQGSKPEGSELAVVEEAAELVQPLLPHISTVFVTLGQYGVLVARDLCQGDHLPIKGHTKPSNGELSIEHYPIPAPCDDIVSVSGAGDCLNAGIISQIMRGEPTGVCIQTGLMAAMHSLPHYQAIPETLTPQLLQASLRDRVFAGYSTSTVDICRPSASSLR